MLLCIVDRAVAIGFKINTDVKLASSMVQVLDTRWYTQHRQTLHIQHTYDKSLTTEQHTLL